METLLGMHETKSGSTFYSSTDAPWGNIGIKMKRGELDNSVGEDKYLDQLVPCDEYNFWWDNKECVEFKLGESRDIQHYYNHLCNHPNSYWWKDTDMSIPEGSMDKSNFLPSIFDKVPQTPFTLISQNQYSEIGWKYLIPKEVDDWLCNMQIEKYEKREGLKGDALQESFNFRPISEVFKSTKSKSLLIDRGSSNDSPILINYFEPKVARKLVCPRGGRNRPYERHKDENGVPIEYFGRVKCLGGQGGWYPLDYILTISTPISFKPHDGSGSRSNNVCYATHCFTITCDQMLKDLSYLQTECHKESIADDMMINIGCITGYERQGQQMSGRQWSLPWTISGLSRTIMNSLNYVHYSTLKEVRESSTINTMAQVRDSADLLNVVRGKVIRPEVNVSILPSIIYLNKPKNILSGNRTGTEVSGHERSGHWRTNWKTGKKDIWIPTHEVKGGYGEGKNRVAKLVRRSGKLVTPTQKDENKYAS